VTQLNYVQLETITTRGFAVQLFDGYTNEPQLQCPVMVTMTGYTKNKGVPFQQTDSSTFVFFDLNPGQYAVSVAINQQTPFYLPTSFQATVPPVTSLWQVFPDISLADVSLELDDPSQPAAYLPQRSQATLQPTPHYPFRPGASLVRGVVTLNSLPIQGATVIRVGDTTGTTTDANGEYVLSFSDWSSVPATETIQATAPGVTNPVTKQITVQRGTTVSASIEMNPTATNSSTTVSPNT
jgi:hypothetical protein